jgi:LmbE family N-acetylglucosaminyl deacetylase
MPQPVRLVAFTAHPDDEFGMCAAEFLHLKECYGPRIETVIACATGGENYARQGFDPSVRPDELRRAAALLRVDRVHLLGFRNGEMIRMLGPINGRVIQNEREIPVNGAWFGGLRPEWKWEDHVEATRILGSLTFGMSPEIAAYDWRGGLLSELLERVVRIIRQERADVVVTMEPFGNYGHNEHIMIHHAATAGSMLAGRADVWPEHADGGLAPCAPRKLYWGGIERRRPNQDPERARRIAEARAEMGVLEYEPSLVVRYPELAERVYTALCEHASQFDLAPWETIPEESRAFFGTSSFLRVYPPAVERELPETSIVDGLV